MIDSHADKISFVLPLTLKETNLSLKQNLTWRQANDEAAALTRTRLLLRSFLKMFEQSDLLDFFVICPRADAPQVSSLLSSLTTDRRYRILIEDDFGIDCVDSNHQKIEELHGWYYQQILKLAISEKIRSAHYVTLDSDIFCAKPFSYPTLIKGGRALTNIETPDDYSRLYSPSFVAIETHIKAMRYAQSAEILGYIRSEPLKYRFYGETPVIFHTASIRAMLDHLTSQHESHWSNMLASKVGWTEYSLYFQYLEMTGELESVCLLAGCNSVLDLERSVWHETRRYRGPRLYDGAHFRGQGEATAEGPFIAVQSWLPAPSWLPARFKNIQEFYREIETKLLLD
jgi:hypothetical protein